MLADAVDRTPWIDTQEHLVDGAGRLRALLETARATGYLRSVDPSEQRLFGLRLVRDTCEEIDRRCRELRTPGYYQQVLRDVAKVERCRVNPLEQDPFRETARQDVLEQDVGGVS